MTSEYPVPAGAPAFAGTTATPQPTQAAGEGSLGMGVTWANPAAEMVALVKMTKASADDPGETITLPMLASWIVPVRCTPVLFAVTWKVTDPGPSLPETGDLPGYARESK